MGLGALRTVESIPAKSGILKEYILVSDIAHRNARPTCQTGAASQL